MFKRINPPSTMWCAAIRAHGRTRRAHHSLCSVTNEMTPLDENYYHSIAGSLGAHTWILWRLLLCQLEHFSTRRSVDDDCWLWIVAYEMCHQAQEVLCVEVMYSVDHASGRGVSSVAQIMVYIVREYDMKARYLFTMLIEDPECSQTSNPYIQVVTSRQSLSGSLVLSNQVHLPLPRRLPPYRTTYLSHTLHTLHLCVYHSLTSVTNPNEHIRIDRWAHPRLSTSGDKQLCL